MGFKATMDFGVECCSEDWRRGGEILQSAELRRCTHLVVPQSDLASHHTIRQHDAAMTCRLPAELVDAVLDILCNEEGADTEGRNASLHALCLASRAMKQRAAPLLYSTVVLSSPGRAHAFFAAHANGNGNQAMHLHLRHLWCGIVNEVLYDKPHHILANGNPISAAREVAWMQADSTGRYHGFHYSTGADLQSSMQRVTAERTSTGQIQALHVVCPDLGRWAVSLFCRLPCLRQATITLYPSGNWDIEEAKLERVLGSILSSCPKLHSLLIIVGHTVAAAGSRLIRMTRSIPISHAVRRVNDPRISVAASEFLFGVHGRSPADEVVLYTRQLWENRRVGCDGPWPREHLAQVDMIEWSQE